MIKKKLIAIDGLDGSGKGTQTELLKKYFSEKCIPVRYISFPTYHEHYSKLVNLYLSGVFGENPEAVNAYAASSFYAADRYCSYNLDWKKNYDSGEIILCDRYTTGNAVHQLSKLPKEQWDCYLEWLWDYEINKLALPKPDLVIYLCVTPEIAEEHVRIRNLQTGRNIDIHENDTTHFKKSYETALYSAKKLGWSTINCIENNIMRSIENIHKDIIKLIEEVIL